MRTTISMKVLTLAMFAMAATLVAPPAWAGCGCDHPPPSWSVVMPPFGSPGRDITIYADGFSFEPGMTYEVEVGGPMALVVAEFTDRIMTVVPDDVPPGPVEIKVIGAGVDVVYSSELFTALPPPRYVEDRSGIFVARDYEAAIGEDGTVYLALDVGDVVEATQYTFALHELPLHFDSDDVVIYNADGVDLTLFTLEVDDPTQRQWGSYYGWTVESDSNLQNTFYLPQSLIPMAFQQRSSLFTYWRHEFHSYVEAHRPGGTHEVDHNGLHPDATMHVDHGQLIIAIQGVERDSSDPADLSKATPLSPGKRQVNVGWVSLETDEPVELFQFDSLIATSASIGIEELRERDDDDD